MDPDQTAPIEASKHFCKQQKQTTLVVIAFVVIGALRVKLFCVLSCSLFFYFGM